LGVNGTGGRQRDQRQQRANCKEAGANRPAPS